MYIYIYILCVWRERERERESRITRKGSMQIRQTRRQYSKLLSLRACLYINRHALVSLSVCGVCNLQTIIRIRNWTVDKIIFHAYRTIQRHPAEDNPDTISGPLKLSRR